MSPERRSPGRQAVATPTRSGAVGTGPPDLTRSARAQHRAGSFRRDSGSVCRLLVLPRQRVRHFGPAELRAENKAAAVRQPTRSRRPSPTSGSAPGSPGPRFPRRRVSGLPPSPSSPPRPDGARSTPRLVALLRARSEVRERPVRRTSRESGGDQQAARQGGPETGRHLGQRGLPGQVQLLDGVGCMVGRRHAGWAGR